MDIQWETPPEQILFRHRNRGAKYTDFALGLRANPGEWAVAPAEMANTEKSAQGACQAIRTGRLGGFEKGYYEAVHEGAKIWVRCKPREEWPPEKAAAATPVRTGSDDDPPEDPEDEDGEGPQIITPTTDAKDVREWARKNGWPELSDRGRLASEITEAYAAAHPQPDLEATG